MTTPDLAALCSALREHHDNATYESARIDLLAAADAIERLVRERDEACEWLAHGESEYKAERDAARAECESWKKQAEIQAGSLQEARAECERLRARVAELEQHIAKYRREAECTEPRHWRDRAQALEWNWSQCSAACAKMQTERDAARAECERLRIALRDLESVCIERDRLRAENEAMRYDLGILRQYHHEGCMAEIEALRKDATRYRWLRVRINWRDKKIAGEGPSHATRWREWVHDDYRESPPDVEHVDEYIDSSLGGNP